MERGEIQNLEIGGKSDVTAHLMERVEDSVLIKRFEW